MKCRLPVQHFCFKRMPLGGGSPRPLPGNSGSSPLVGRRKAGVRQTAPSAADAAPPALHVPRSGCGGGPRALCYMPPVRAVPREGPWRPRALPAGRMFLPTCLSSGDKLQGCRLGMWYNMWQSACLHKLNNSYLCCRSLPSLTLTTGLLCSLP